MKDTILNTKPRTESGKNAVGRLRRQGNLPANLIADGKSTMLSIDASEFRKLLNSGLRQSSLFTLNVGEKSEKVFVKELARDPVSGTVLHVDFYRVTAGRKVMVTVPIEHTGVARGVKVGGALEQFINSIKVKSAPEDLIDVMQVDVSALDVGDAIHLKDLKIPANWEVLLEGNPLIIKVAHSRMARADEGAPGEEGKTAEAAAATAQT